MYLALGPSRRSELMALATSSPRQAKVTLRRVGPVAIRSRASRPTKAWSNLTNGP